MFNNPNRTAGCISKEGVMNSFYIIFSFDDEKLFAMIKLLTNVSKCRPDKKGKRT